MHQDRYFAAHGLALRVDANAAVPGRHVGPVRMRVPGSEVVERAEAVAKENAAAARDPERVLAVLTRNAASFTERELDRYLAKHIHDHEEHVAVKGAVLGRDTVLALYDPETGQASGRYTTREVRSQERTALADGAQVAAGRHRALGAGAQAAGLAGRTLRADQKAAFDHAVGPGGLKIVEGRAGTGKSYTLGAIRDAHERAGYAVLGLAPTNTVAQDLKADGFGRRAGAGRGTGADRSAGADRAARLGSGPREGRAATVHSELFRLKNGHASWDARTLVVVDEAAMLDARVTGELLAEARRSGAKVLLAGDDRQLASIERGGLFPELRRVHGSAEITEVTRQKVDWQRQAARDLSEGRTYEAMAAFARNGALHWSGRQVAARDALVARWTADTDADPAATRFVFAYTNKEVDALNADLRAVRKDRGELGEDVRFETKHGPADFAVGDRVQVTETLREARLWNGNAGIITGIDARTGRITARLDGPGAAAGTGREVSWSAATFTGFRHGYAGTIYKGQGKTIDHTYLLHSAHWRQAASYVALTRQRESAAVFAATETATDLGQLARQMSRREMKGASLSWATRDELPEALRPVAEQSGVEPSVAKQSDAALSIAVHGSEPDEGAFPATPVAGNAPEGRAARAGQGASADPGIETRPDGSEGLTPDGAAAPRWLIAPRVGEVRDDPEARVAAMAADPAVRRERAALETYLQGAYRDPRAAQARLAELVETQGVTSAARRIAADPDQLGALAGGSGLLAGRGARRTRAQAEHVARAVGPALRRLGEAEAHAAQGYSAGLAARQAAEATGVPGLSERAQAAIRTLGAAETPEARAEAWGALQAEDRVAGEVTDFVQAVEKRFGLDAVRAMDRHGAAAAEGTVLGAADTDRSVLAEIGAAVQLIRHGARDAAQGARLAARAQMRQGPKMSP